MHYALTIRTVHFSLKNSDCKNISWPLLTPGVHPDFAQAFNLVPPRCSPDPEPMQHLSQLSATDFFSMLSIIFTAESTRIIYVAVLATNSSSLFFSKRGYLICCFWETGYFCEISYLSGYYQDIGYFSLFLRNGLFLRNSLFLRKKAILDWKKLATCDVEAV
jgi:hypothetical protein